MTQGFGPEYVYVNIGKAQESVQKLIDQAVESAKSDLRKNPEMNLKEALIGACNSMMQSGDTQADKFYVLNVLPSLGIPEMSPDMSLRGNEAIARLEKRA